MIRLIQDWLLDRKMWKRLSTLLLLLAAVGCHSQVTPNPTAYTCPPSNSTTYTPLNQSSPATGTTYVDTHPTAGTYCYIDQSEAVPAVSLPSNTAGPFTLGGSTSTTLTWTPPTSGITPVGYYISRAPAISSTILAPTITNGNVAEVRPALPETPMARPTYDLAMNAPVLQGKVTK